MAGELQQNCNLCKAVYGEKYAISYASTELEETVSKEENIVSTQDAYL